MRFEFRYPGFQRRAECTGGTGANREADRGSAPHDCCGSASVLLARLQDDLDAVVPLVFEHLVALGRVVQAQAVDAILRGGWLARPPWIGTTMAMPGGMRPASAHT